MVRRTRLLLRFLFCLIQHRLRQPLLGGLYLKQVPGEPRLRICFGPPASIVASLGSGPDFKLRHRHILPLFYTTTGLAREGLVEGKATHWDRNTGASIMENDVSLFVLIILLFPDTTTFVSVLRHCVEDGAGEHTNKGVRTVHTTHPHHPSKKAQRQRRAQMVLPHLHL